MKNILRNFLITLRSYPLVVALKNWIDEQYEQGRQTVISHGEMEEAIARFAPDRF